MCSSDLDSGHGVGARDCMEANVGWADVHRWTAAHDVAHIDLGTLNVVLGKEVVEEAATAVIEGNAFFHVFLARCLTKDN